MKTQEFNLEKAINAVLYVAYKLRKKDIHRIFKILYFADRDHLSEYGRSITGDSYVRMEYGPVPSSLYDIIKAVRGDGYWSSKVDSIKLYFDITDNKNLIPKKVPDMDVLSPSDIEELDKYCSEFQCLSFKKVTDSSHLFSWKNTEPDRIISMDNILKEVGDSKNYIEHVKHMLSIKI